MSDRVTAELFVPVHFDIVNHVGYIVLCNPPENRMNMQFFRCMKEIVAAIKKSDTLRGLIICSQGRHFSSGADLDELAGVLQCGAGVENHRNINEQLQVLDENTQCFLDIACFDYPVVAALQGLCMGSALELALCADVRIVEERVTLGLPEVHYGVIPGCGGTVRLTKLVGAAKALELILSGQLLSAEDACAAGLADMVVPRKTAVVKARELLMNTGRGCSKADFAAMVRNTR